ncbi:MAG: C40 family peptidase [Thermoleophilia bacterium]|nr:C40 family peptidase [Thermoleophilia bacterium]MDH4344819.1 C40 family peptidase [Thermoleophilia bacterium]MDH5333773.1 C40 family peptidase [Thermoleophilia bacterium]
MPRLRHVRLLALVTLVVAGGAPGAGTGPEPAGAAGPLATTAAPRPWPLEVPLRPIPRRATLGERAARLAPRWLGAPYRYGGATPVGFDCSGFTRFVYGKLGVALPHNAAAQYGLGRPVALSRLRPGDLVFSYGLGHVGIYLGAGKMIHAPQSGERVKIVPLAHHYGERLVGARRLVAS